MVEHDRHGARQPERFNPERAASLNDRTRFDYLPPKDLISLLGLAPKEVLIDFGAGTGLYAIEIAALRPEIQVIGVDEQEKMIEFLSENLVQSPLKNIKALWTKDEKYSHLKKTADGVLALNVLHELGDRAMEEIQALLKPSGRVLFVDWNSEIERPVGPPRDHVYSPQEGRLRVLDFGFSVIKERMFPYHYALLCGVKN